MSVRAAAAEATRERIVVAAQRLFDRSWYDDVTLRGIAREAGVALQTLVNHFGSKEALYAAAAERTATAIAGARWGVAPGDVAGAVEALVADYEEHGDMVLRTLAVEGRVPVVAPTLALGRTEHERWNATTFAAALEHLDQEDRRRRLAQLVAVTDVWTWKLLRRDKGLSREQTALAIRELVLALHRPEGEDR